MGSNNNIFDYAEVTFELCTGDRKTLVHDDGRCFRELRNSADNDERLLILMAQSGKPIREYQERQGGDPWLVGLPPHGHIVRVAVLKCNRLSEVKRQIRSKWVTCSHVQQAQAGGGRA